jgi:hypothetical protein
MACTLLTDGAATVDMHQVAELAFLNTSNLSALSDIVGKQEEAGAPIIETATSAALRAQGRK